MAEAKKEAIPVRQENLLGTVGVGKAADLVVLDANPLDSFRTRRRFARSCFEAGSSVANP